MNFLSITLKMTTYEVWSKNNLYFQISWVTYVHVKLVHMPDIYVDNMLTDKKFGRVLLCSSIFYYLRKNLIKEIVLTWWLGFDFNVIAIHPWCVNSYDSFKEIWIVVDSSQHLLSNVQATLLCLKLKSRRIQNESLFVADFGPEP